MDSDKYRVSYKALFENIRNGVAVFEPVKDGECFVFLEFNKAAEVIDNIDKKDVIGKCVKDVFPSVIPTGLAGVFKQVYETGQMMNHGPAFHENPSAAGWREYWVYRLPSGEIVAVYTDETSSIESQQALIHTERMKAVMELSSGIVHNFNNGLQLIMGNINLAQMNCNDSATAQYMRDATIACKNAAQTLKRLQFFIGDCTRGEMMTEMFNVVKTLKDAIQITKPWWSGEPEKLGKELKMRVNIEDVECYVKGIENEIIEVFVNMIKNAVEAMVYNGILTISLELRDGKVCVSFSDTGVGIPTEQIDRIWEPFFSTKGKEGAGLGLSTCYGIIKNHSGNIDVFSKEGVGTTFKVVLKCCEERREIMECNNHICDRELSVLVIDDSAMLLSLLSKGLEAFGCNVTCASSGEKGVVEFQDNHIDVVICDLGMPGLNGWQVARIIKQLSPKTPFILFTGWGQQISPKEGDAPSVHVDAILQKPADVHELIKVIREFF